MTTVEIGPPARLVLEDTELRLLEDLALAVGRLDATAGNAPESFRQLLVLRCATRPFDARREGMIALLDPDSEGNTALRQQLQRLMEPVDRRSEQSTSCFVDAVRAARQSAEAGHAEVRAVAEAALAATRALQAGGAIAGPWLSFPLVAGSPISIPSDAGDMFAGVLASSFQALTREARAAERGLGAARNRATADEQRVRDELGRAAHSALRVLTLFRTRLSLNIPDAARALGVTPPTVSAAVGRLEEMGIIREVTGRERSRVFAYAALVDALAP